MIPILYPASEKNFTSHGIGPLTDAISCEPEICRNGSETLEMIYPIGGAHYDDLVNQNIIYATCEVDKDPQPFRIKRITAGTSGTINVYAEHVRYDLSGIPVGPCTGSNASEALAALKSASLITNDFSVYTDLDTEADYEQTTPASFLQQLGGVDESILDVYGGEYFFDKFTVKLLSSRGSARGVSIKYGKNLVSLEQEASIENLHTGALCYYTGTVNDSEVTVYGSVQYVSGHESYPRERIAIVDVSSEYDEAPTADDLTTRAAQYVSDNDLGVPRVSLTVDFLDLSQTTDYDELKPIEKVNLCDTVTVVYPDLNISVEAKVIRVKYNTLLDRYIEVEIGDPRYTLDAAIADVAQSVTNASNVIQQSKDTMIQQAVANLTDLITNGLGLFFSRVSKADGGYQYYLHNQPDRNDSQYQWTINSSGFAVSQDYGATWTAGIDADGNAVFNSLSANIINAMSIYGSYIEGTTIKFESGAYSVTASPTTWVDDDEVTYGGVAFTGNGDIGLTGRSIGIKATDASRNVQIEAEGSIKVFADDEITIMATDGNHSYLLTLSSNGLSYYIDGVGYSGLHFVDDGNGHAVLGV